MKRSNHAIVASLLGAGLFSQAVFADTSEWIAHGKTGMVASDSPEASRIGAEILKTGGNAFDAAVATSFALSVARPHSTGLGGGGFMIAYVAKENRFVALDFRETAPAGAIPEHYSRLHAQRGDGPSASVCGGNAVATPGQLAGLAEINKRYGSRELANLIEPAIELAEGGYVVDQNFLDARESMFKKLDKWPQLRGKYKHITDLLTPNGAEPKLGDKFIRPDLAGTLRLIATKGPDVFYHGEIGQAIVKAVQSTGGTLLLSDLTRYRVVEREPLRIGGFFTETPFQHELITMPPPSSGGVCMAEILHIQSSCALRSDINPDGGWEHVLIEAMKHAFADRARWLGDPDHYPIPVAGLISPRYGMSLAREISANGTKFWTDYGSKQPPPDDDGTSHFCVADKAGNIVALTETINGTFGSLVVVEPYGIILNNEIDDFLTVPGQENMFGLLQGDANLVGPHKRPLSSMSPTIVLRDGKPLLVLGASGGPRIITSVLQVAQHVMNGKSLEDAITELRMHHQWQPDEIFFDRQPAAKLVENLKKHGHKLGTKRKTGIVQAIHFLDDGTMIGASDPKKGGSPAAAK